MTTLKNAYSTMRYMIRKAEQMTEDQGGLWDNFSLIWEGFWAVNDTIVEHIESYDPDTTYKEDIMARFRAIEDYLIEKGEII